MYGGLGGNGCKKGVITDEGSSAVWRDLKNYVTRRVYVIDSIKL